MKLTKKGMLNIFIELGGFSWKYIVKPVVSVIRTVRDEVEILEGERENVRVLITEAIGNAGSAQYDVKDGRIITIAQQLRIIDFLIEDVFEQWNSYLIHQGACIQVVDGWLPFDDHGCVAFSYENFNWVDYIPFIRLQIAMRIRQIKSGFEDIKKICDKKGIKTKSSSKQGLDPNITWKKLGLKAYNTNHKQKLVGFKDPIKKLTDWLENVNPDCKVMVVVGMAGQGKTTLARQIFENEEVIKKFKLRAWICVSDFNDPKEFFLSLLQKLNEQVEGTQPVRPDMGLESMEKEVKKLLAKKRYVLFFDDVWSKNFLKDIKDGLKDSENGSRIIITTRNKEVANNCKAYFLVDVHQMQPLLKKDSLELFRQTAKVDNINTYSFRKLSEDVVGTCEGLPLGIVAIGKHLSVCSRQQVDNWKTNIEEAGITDIIRYSYDDLPDHLKPCLLYFGIYPQGYRVKSERLIRQWIAEGFVEKKKKITVEEVAQDYLTSLVDRNLVQVSSVTVDGKPRSCRVHPLVHDMILRISEDLSFCCCFNEETPTPRVEITRRLSIATNATRELHGFFDDLLVERFGSSFIRSMHFFTKQQKLPESFVNRILAKDRPLKVLDFQNSMLSSIGQNLGELIHLKYLSFRNTQIECLPSSIGKLQNLETLDLRQTRVKEVPKEVSKLRKLQHLLGDEISLIQLKDSIKDMTSLQTLRGVKLEDEEGIETELGKLWRIKDLGLSGVGDKHGKILCTQINTIEGLEKLRIAVKPENEVIDLEAMEKERKLQKFHLYGKLKKVPNWILGFKQLAKLVLSGSKLVDDPLKSLKGNPYLSFLSIIDEAYEGESLVFEDGGFAVLEELELGSLLKLCCITIQSKETMPSLKKLHLKKIPQLKRVPSDIQHLSKLEDLNIKDMGADFKQSIAPGGQQKHQVVKHVPHVRINGVLVEE